MTPVDILKTFDREPGIFALVATYDFDPEFFEGRLLRTKGFGNATRILILMDHKRYAELLIRGIEATSFNRRYLVLPVKPSSGVFHPKLYLVLGKKSVTAMVGSANCTCAGVAYNMELCSTFSAELNTERAVGPEGAPIIREIYEAIRNYALENQAMRDVLEEHFFEPIEEGCPWLDRDVFEIGRASDIVLLNSSDQPLVQQIRHRLRERSVTRISVLSPFYDNDLGMLEIFTQLWPSARLDVIAQPKYSPLPKDELARLFSREVEGRLLAATPAPGRRLHAKAFAFETDTGTYWLVGSANATNYGLGGENTEACLWFVTTDPFESILDEEILSLEEIHPRDFIPGEFDEPGAVKEEVKNNLISLSSVILFGDGQVRFAAQSPTGVSELKLQIKNVGQEYPVLSRQVSMNQSGQGTITFDGDQIAQIESAAVCEMVGQIQGQAVTSNAVALVQLNRLLRDQEGGGKHGNSLKRIAETGEGLNKHVDSLGDIRDVIDFFRNTNIRFYDSEEQQSVLRRNLFKPRDPYTNDTPNTWGGLNTEGDTENLREAIRDFVKRHQKEKLVRHVRRGNLNGLSNFLDIFRTLNTVLLTWHSRRLEDGTPIVPPGYVTSFMQQNIALLIGTIPEAEEYESGFVDAIRANLQTEDELIRERLNQSFVAPMLRAAVEALVDVRENARGLDGRDGWALSRIHWVLDWIERSHLEMPTNEDVEIARREYLPSEIAA